jgi:hypothetical protein
MQEGGAAAPIQRTPAPASPLPCPGEGSVLPQADPWYHCSLHAKAPALPKQSFPGASSFPPAGAGRASSKYSQPPGRRERDLLLYSERCDGIIGNVSWQRRRLTNAKSPLASVGVKDGEVASIVASYSNVGGSSRDIVCSSPSVLQRLRLLVKQQRVKFRKDIGAKCARIDRRKSRGELRPCTLVRRAQSFIQDLEQQTAPSKGVPVAEVTVDFGGELIEAVGLGRMGFSIAGMWRWLPATCGCYVPEMFEAGLD